MSPTGNHFDRAFVERILRAPLPNTVRIEYGDSIWTPNGTLDGPALVTFGRAPDGDPTTRNIRVPTLT